MGMNDSLNLPVQCFPYLCCGSIIHGMQVFQPSAGHRILTAVLAHAGDGRANRPAPGNSSPLPCVFTSAPARPGRLDIVRADLVSCSKRLCEFTLLLTQCMAVHVHGAQARTCHLLLSSDHFPGVCAFNTSTPLHFEIKNEDRRIRMPECGAPAPTQHKRQRQHGQKKQP